MFREKEVFLFFFISVFPSSITVLINENALFLVKYSLFLFSNFSFEYESHHEKNYCLKGINMNNWSEFMWTHLSDITLSCVWGKSFVSWARQNHCYAFWILMLRKKFKELTARLYWLDSSKIMSRWIHFSAPNQKYLLLSNKALVLTGKNNLCVSLFFFLKKN